METFVAVVHVIVALGLIALVLVQDSKGGSLGGAFGGGGSNSVFGATGAATLAQKMTRWMAVIFACTCIAMTVFSSRGNKSVIDSVNAGAPAPAASVTPTPTASASPTPTASPTPAQK